MLAAQEALNLRPGVTRRERFPIDLERGAAAPPFRKFCSRSGTDPDDGSLFGAVNHVEEGDVYAGEVGEPLEPRLSRKATGSIQLQKTLLQEIPSASEEDQVGDERQWLRILCGAFNPDRHQRISRGAL
jgi:hypothetical protein